MARDPFDDIVERMEALIEAGQSRSKGDVDEWVASEVHLPYRGVRTGFAG